ncbi:MAG: hypothetical protein JNK04_06520 [Myxococcales bacterium]|nr:hypothetical protein [Myxococcales bacterium]
MRDQAPKRHDRRLMIASVTTSVFVVGGALALFGAPWASKPASRSEDRATNAATNEPAPTTTASATASAPIVTLKSAEPLSTASADPQISAAKTSASAPIKRPTGKLPSVPPLAGNPYGPKR